MPSLGLCMIVKNEAAVMRRCLDSVLPLLNYALIVDTGSSDGTQEVIRKYLHEKQLPGAVLQEPWRDFAYNRSFALQKLREQQHIDYGLMIDADEILVFEPEFDAGAFKRQLSCDIYDIETRYGNLVYWRPQLVSNRLPFSYRGVLHEYLDIQQPFTRAKAQGFFNHPLQDSARSHNPRKFQDDAALLEKALQHETDPFLIARYHFYLAQSYRDSGEHEKSLQHYLQRSRLGYWQEEIYVSLLNAARQKEAQGFGDADIIQSYLDAYEALPSRLEALHDAVRFCRLRGKYQQGYLLAKHALGLAAPTDGLFIEHWINDYGLLDEFSIVAYWAGHYQPAWDACLKLWNSPALPDEHRPRVLENARYIIEKLGQPDLANLLRPVGKASTD